MSLVTFIIGVVLIFVAIPAALMLGTVFLVAYIHYLQEKRQ